MDESKAFQVILEKLDGLEKGQKRLEDQQTVLGQSQKRLEDQQIVLEHGQKALEAGQKQANDRIDRLVSDVSIIKEDVKNLKEEAVVTRETVNSLLEWVEKAEIQVQVPFLK